MDQKVWKNLYDKNGHLVYEGYTLLGKPFGRGTVYFPNGNKFQEGKFAEKGLVGYGKEYWSNCKLKVEAKFIKNRRYGPNYPSVGTFYNQEGVKVFSGDFIISGGGMVYKPEGYKENLPEDQMPDITYFNFEHRYELKYPYTGETMVCPICGATARVRRHRNVHCLHCGWTIATGKKHTLNTVGLFPLEEYKKYWEHGVQNYDEFKEMASKAYASFYNKKETDPQIQASLSEAEYLIEAAFREKKYGDTPQMMFLAALACGEYILMWY